MIEVKLDTVERNSPLRCQGSFADGRQCPYKSEPNSQYCFRHGANKMHQSLAAKAMSMYRLGQYQARVSEFADHEQVKSLRAEIGILRMTLETIIQGLQTPVMFAIHSGRISDTVLKIEKLVTSCQRLETATGEMMDKTKVLQIGQTIVEIIGRHVADAELLEVISDDILTAILGKAA